MKLPPLPGLVLIVLLWTAFYAVQGVYAAEESAARESAAAARPDMRVLIDISGSMKKTDPQNLRVPAAKLLLNLAQEDSRFGVWAFGQYVNNLVPVAPVNPDWKRSAVDKLEAINSAGLFTNVGLALERAAMGQTAVDPAWERTIVLLSDGMVDVSKDPAVNAAEKERILSQVIPQLKKAGFRIHSVALSESADQAFLKAVALRTGGAYSLARNADELMKVFVEASDKVNLPEQVPLIGDSFTIDDSIKEFTALIFRQSSPKETRLISPDGTEYSLSQGSRNVSWFADKQYDLITVYNPAPGTWKVVADLDPANRVTVVSDLNLNMEGLPENVLEGERLTMTLSLDEHGRVITNPNFLELMDITFRQDTSTGDSFEGKLSQGSDGNKVVPPDGFYSARLGRTITQGEHTFSVLVDGKTFQRKKSVRMTVHREVLKVETRYRDQDGQVLRYLMTEPVEGLVNPEAIDIVAQITDPKGEKSIQKGVIDGGQEGAARYRIDVPPYGALGEYEVLIKVTGTSANDKPFELVQGPYTVDYTPLGMVADSAPSVEEKPPLPSETFDASAMEIPSLEVEELPPDDIPPLPEVEPVPEPEPVLMGEELPPVEDASEAEEGSNWLLLAGVFVLGNLLVIGGGIYLYIKVVRKTDAEQSRVVEEITQMQQKKAEQRSQAAAELAQDFDAGTDFDLGEEATQIRTSEPAAEAPDPIPPAPTPASSVPDTPAVAAEPEQDYVNDADPMELEDDELIEVDDEFDDLDMMLSEQENSEQTEEQLNQAIDEMLEQPTVFPDPDQTPEEEKPSEEDKLKPDETKPEETEDERSIEEKYPGFDNDEFMLDNPSKN
ncbi:MAG: VWA domain-containing protein [Pseudomonadota bacterium]|nr:VWA domain-containing protein [Pseudomonadota bacterium]